MTNIQKFFGSSPGVIFIFVFILTSLSSNEFFSALASYAKSLLDGDRAHLLSFMALLIVILGFASVALSLIVGRIWDALFYFFGGGYDRTEYEFVRTALLNKLSNDSEAAVFLRKSKIQPLYGTILHSYAPTTYIEWLGRRWTSFNNSGLQATASVIGVLSAFLFSTLMSLSSPSYLFLIVFLLIFPGITMYIGNARLKEVLASEELFCRSLVDEELGSAVSNVASKVSERGGSTDGVPELGGRL